MLIVFPAGEVASWSRHHRRVLDPQWNRNMARIARMTGAKSIPAFISGTNSVGFHLAGMINPRLRTLFLPHELINKRGRRMEIRIGAPVEGETLKAIHDDEKAIDLLRWNSSLLALRDRIDFAAHPFLPRPLAAPSTPSLRRKIPPSCCASCSRCPPTPCWNPPARCASMPSARVRRRASCVRSAACASSPSAPLARAPARRATSTASTPITPILCCGMTSARRSPAPTASATCSSVLHRYGLRGLYTATLFRFQPKFFAKVGPALELGRSFVHLDYQRQYAPLLVLWKGIGSYLVRHPETPMLFGAVSISADYSMASREVLTSYLSAHTVDAELLKMLRPKHPPRAAGRKCPGARNVRPRLLHRRHLRLDQHV